MIRLAARGITAGWDPATGHLPFLRVNQTDVLHRAPWRGDPAIQADTSIPVVDRTLGGTFVCAPFGQNDEGPPHGETANAPWSVRRSSPSALVAARQTPRGHVSAQVTLRDGHPVLYQTHILDLTAPCTFAHHPMVALAGAGRLSTKPPAKVLTFQGPTTDGTALYAPNQSSDGFTIETATGPRDLRDYPKTACDDFVALIHNPGLIWTAIARAEEGDTIVTLKRAEQLPLTGLWLSNGARQDAPWHGRAGVLGIEDARCAGADGFAAALSGETAVSAPTVFPPGRHVVPHAIVHLRGCHTIIGAHIQAEHLTFETKISPITIPFDGSHFS